MATTTAEHPTLARLREAAATDTTLEARRARLEAAATFASLSIRTPTRRAEQSFLRWILLGKPDDLSLVSGQLAGTRTKRLASLRALPAAQIDYIFTAGSPLAEMEFADWTWGYGPAKACFALACAGVGQIACIDGRLERKYMDRLKAVARGSWAAGSGSWPIYMDAVRELYGYGDSASLQWAEWLADLRRERYSTDHGFLVDGDPQLRLFEPEL